VRLPLALAELGLIDEYEFVVQPRLVGHGPTLFAGLSKWVDLKLVSRLEFGSGRCGMNREGSHASGLTCMGVLRNEAHTLSIDCTDQRQRELRENRCTIKPNPSRCGLIDVS
jgi:hypothetical protein